MPDIKSTQVKLLFRIDIGFDAQRGYAAAVLDIQHERQKGIRGNSPEQLISRMRNVLLEEFHKQRNFPLESEPGGNHSPIIMPDSGDPLFGAT
jgi:hypothetical protein